MNENQKLTPWYPGHVKPTRVGVYETDSRGSLYRCFQFWNGIEWHRAHTTVEKAAESECVSMFQNDKWRGPASAEFPDERAAFEALEKIAAWNSHDPMLGVDYGSNGVRDFYRKIARAALAAKPVPDDVRKDAERYRWLRDVAWNDGSLVYFDKRYGNEEWDERIDDSIKGASHG